MCVVSEPEAVQYRGDKSKNSKFHCLHPVGALHIAEGDEIGIAAIVHIVNRKWPTTLESPLSLVPACDFVSDVQPMVVGKPIAVSVWKTGDDHTPKWKPTRWSRKW